MTRGPEVLPLTPGQCDLYAADRSAEDPATYNSALFLRVDGTLDEAALRTRFAELLAAHPLLGSRVTEDQGRLVFVPGRRPPKLFVADAPVDPDGPLARARLRREALRPFDLDDGPLLRVVLIRHSPRTAHLCLTAHHLIVDETSMAVLAQWLLGDAPGLPAESFAQWSLGRHELPPERRERAAELARRLRPGVSAALEWARTPGPEPAGPSGAVPLLIRDAVWDAAGGLATELGITRHSLVLAAAGLVLSRNSATARPVLGTTVSRRTPRHATAVGYFSATVPVPLETDGDQTVTDYLRGSHQRAMTAYRDADLPLSTVLPPSDRAGLSLVVVPCRTLPDIVTPELTATSLPDPGFGPAQFPLALYVRQDLGGERRGLLRHRATEVDTAAATRFCRQLETTLAAMAQNPSAPLARLSTVPATEPAGPAGPSSGDTVTAGADLASLFAEQAARLPDHVAVSCEKQRLTYRELDDRATAVARSLAEAGVRAGDRVGVCMHRGTDLVVALLAVLKAGAAYVPLNPDYPRERLAFVAEDTGLTTAVTDCDPDLLPSHLTLLPADATPARTDTPLPGPDPERVAYVIHTSGSTGTPKGVLVRHHNVAALLAATAGPEGFGFGEEDVWSLFHSFAFDFSVWEIWGCLLTGGRLVVVPHWIARDPEGFHALLAAERVTVLNQTPSAFAQLLAADAASADDLFVRLLIFGGEPLDPRMLLPWMDRYPERTCRVVNMYGITETTVHCTWRDLTRADALSGTRSVGSALPGWRLYVLDEEGRQVAPGVPGEIHVAGSGVSAGYLNRPELTAERFVPGSSVGLPEEVLYRSGDRGRLLPDGQLEHLGRLDDQVKIRGHRIELGEIGGALLAHAAVTGAAAVVRDAHDAATARIDAYFVGTDAAPDLAELRRWLAARLPSHMLPATLTPVPSLPLTVNGKLDPSRLPEPARGNDTAPPQETTGTGRPAAPGEPVAADRLARVWQELLGVPVGPDDNFFELGGNSLLAVRLNTLQRTAGFPGSQLKHIFRNPTPRRLAAIIGPPSGGRANQEEA
ncbi:non-ribosomal peptide synthetase [Streptomyces triticiradicis]|uniref:Amino acid adenylation domain-containing protein n=1 Tax=Streptomyces triticiradicis TaxID=2651189 RepID=A0A7J5D7K9_9ACTN|nr:amino acid adenylation domain-containing protein [Streptomyces triticiradicis]KAB1981752.1 amino acid adenylation domain-containing protein [Streptomyces triticiradicis]